MKPFLPNPLSLPPAPQAAPPTSNAATTPKASSLFIHPHSRDYSGSTEIAIPSPALGRPRAASLAFGSMKNPGMTAIGTWSGGRFMHFGEEIAEERLIDLLRPGAGSTP